MNIDKINAIKSLSPDAEVSQHGDNIIWHNPSEPTVTEVEIDAEVVRLQSEYDAQAYSRKREVEYPSVQECVHAILDNQLDALQAKRVSVKLKYPKGG